MMEGAKKDADGVQNVDMVADVSERNETVPNVSHEMSANVRLVMPMEPSQAADENQIDSSAVP